LYFSVNFDVDETELSVQTLRIKIGASIKAEIAKFIERSVSIEWFLDGCNKRMCRPLELFTHRSIFLFIVLRTKEISLGSLGALFNMRN